MFCVTWKVRRFGFDKAVLLKPETLPIFEDRFERKKYLLLGIFLEIDRNFWVFTKFWVMNSCFRIACQKVTHYSMQHIKKCIIFFFLVHHPFGVCVRVKFRHARLFTHPELTLMSGG